MVLMIAGSMSIRSAINALAVNTGYDTSHAFSLDVQFPENASYPAARKLAAVQSLRERLAALPGVAAITSARPPVNNLFRTAAAPAEPSQVRISPSIVRYSYIQSNYFDTLGIPLTLGRGFPSQAAQQDLSVILSESAARQLWPGQNPVGRTLRLGPVDERLQGQPAVDPGGPAYQVIGVARDTSGGDFDGLRRVYLAMTPDRLATYPLLIRTLTSPSQVIRGVGPVVSSVDPAIVATPTTLQEMLRQSAPFLIASVAAAVALTVGLLGLLLASMGIYGTVSYIVVLRTREVGIRMAVGAQKRDVLALILGETARPVFTGLIAGVLLAAGASYLARGLLFGINGIDGISMAAISLLFSGVALLAAYPPARRAMRVDPMVALRYE